MLGCGPGGVEHHVPTVSEVVLGLGQQVGVDLVRGGRGVPTCLWEPSSQLVGAEDDRVDPLGQPS